ncbi:hypothetical protein AQJ67_18430 [Streptomyces caeruleatus]|uniref:Uncharacterized protein n=1 Tax=Streptomyces caeruleatus TaxID=661399 RepID=A0A124I9M9_9ACTN|nr:hypothetical protein AQJ67_18430 [Streptomyces caeruleatus]
MKIVPRILVTLESCPFPPASRYIIPVQELKDFCYAPCFLRCRGIIDLFFQESVQFTDRADSMVSVSVVFQAGGGGRGPARRLAPLRLDRVLADPRAL